MKTRHPYSQNRGTGSLNISISGVFSFAGTNMAPLLLPAHTRSLVDSLRLAPVHGIFVVCDRQSCGKTSILVNTKELAIEEAEVQERNIGSTYVQE